MRLHAIPRQSTIKAALLCVCAVAALYKSECITPVHVVSVHRECMSCVKSCVKLCVKSCVKSVCSIFYTGLVGAGLDLHGACDPSKKTIQLYMKWGLICFILIPYAQGGDLS